MCSDGARGKEYRTETLQDEGNTHGVPEMQAMAAARGGQEECIREQDLHVVN